MTIYTEILGNTATSPEWKKRIENTGDVEYIHLDQWTAQKSRFLGKGDKGNEYPVALKRQSQIKDGDVIYYSPEENRAVVLKLDLNPVLVADLGKLAKEDPETIIRHAVEFGHAIGNQHWPAVVKGTKVYVPLTVDRKVMLSVLETHHIEDIDYKFEEGTGVIPYLAPHEIRRLFGGAGQASHAHIHADGAPHAEGMIVEHTDHGDVKVMYHDHGDGHVHCHEIPAGGDATAANGHTHHEHTTGHQDYDAEEYPVC